jgi:hypothetical protein
MGTLKTTIKLETTNLFPQPVNMTIPVIEDIEINSAFSTIVLEPTTGNPASTIYGPTTGAVGSSNVVYMFVQANASNSSAIQVRITDASANTATALAIIPGDFAWFPVLADDNGVEVELVNTDAANEATAYYFYGEKG